MPYRRKESLPKQIKRSLPEEAQEIYKEAFNSAEEYYADPRKRRNPSDDKEEIAAKIAWSAVKKKFRKGNGGWIKND
jgi:cation transport regulator